MEAWEEDRLLQLCAGMKLPGRVWLQFEAKPIEGSSRITQTAVFDPLGLGGLLYWHGLYPIHWVILRRMLWGVGAGATAARESRLRECRQQEAPATAADRVWPAMPCT